MSTTEWRINTVLSDQSSVTVTSPSCVGFTSVHAYKGFLEPRRFYAGEAQKVLNWLGYPDSTRPEIQSVIDFVSSYDCFVSAPSGTGSLHGGVLVTKTGTISLASGLSSDEINDFSDIGQEESVGTGNGSTTTFNLTLSNIDYYSNTTVDILVDGVSQEVTATDTDPEVLSTTGGDSGSLDRTTGALSYTFATAPSEGAVITVSYSLDVENDCYFALLSKGAQADDLAVIVSDYNSAGQFTLEVYRQDPDDSTSYTEFDESPYTVSIIEGDKDGYGQGVYLTNVFDPDSEDEFWLTPIVNLTAFDTFTDDSDYVDFGGGVRVVGETSDIVEGFDYLTDIDTYSDVNLIFDTTAEANVLVEFETLRGSDSSPGSQGRSKFLAPCAMQTVSSILSDTATAKGNIEERGINFFANSYMYHKDIYNDSPFINSGMGLIARRYGDSKAQSYGALSPSYIDESGIGGQLGSSVIKLVNTATESQLKSLNSAGINGIKKITGSGFTIVADRTSQSSTLSDYSFTIHSDLADYIIKTIEEEILPLQLLKSNDAQHRANVKAKSEMVMNGVDQYLEDWIVKCDEENNTDTIRNQRKFVLTIAVIFEKNSQQIVFNFVNSRSGTDLTQTVNKTA